MSKSEMSRLSVQLTWAREQGYIPWAWIVDEHRQVEQVSTWRDPAQIIQCAVNGYRKDYWNTQPFRIEVWSEKGTVRGILKPVLDEHGLAFRVMHGFGSATAVHDIATFSNHNEKPMIALYVGDWDPSGLWMSEMDLPERIDRYEGNVEIRRIALSISDVNRRTKLKHFELKTKSKDPRARWFAKHYGNKCWELDAMSPVVLRKRVEQHILNLLDIEAWNRCIEVEQAERESMSSLLGTWQSTISGPDTKYSDGVAE